jgi:hypothetical protein
MVLRRLSVALLLVCGLCVWGFAHSDDTPAPNTDPARAENASATGGGNHDDAAIRFRNNQSRHWRHVALGGMGGTGR